ncbi:MAG: alpha/beta hydrolase [Alphaproteobacteria bacterium]|nr:alpha/beta hydrolase [Alphaproteobacteria bacterium]
MASIRSKIFNIFLRRMVRETGLTGAAGLEVVRQREADGGGFLGKLLRSNNIGEKVTIRGPYAEFSGEWVGDETASETLLYLHGGAYFFGGVETHRSMVKKICKLSGLRALVIDYRLAPENPYPAAIEDAEAAYDFLVEQGVRPETLLLAGDSAGGGLSLALMQKLRENDKPQPRAVALMSPWTDLTMSGKSYKERYDRDPMIDAEKIVDAIDFYCPNQDKKNPLISPLFADLTGFPPMFVQVGSEEVLFDDSEKLVQKAKKAGIQTEFEIWDGMPHVFQMAHGFVPESQAALKNMAGFFNR